MAKPLDSKDKSKTLNVNYKLVPWLNWDEWDCVRISLFNSSSPSSVSEALNRIATWRSRGCLPVAIDVTAPFVEIQQKDPYFRKDLSDGAPVSDEILAMLYTMAIMRFVNGVIEKTRKKSKIQKKSKVSIADRAAELGIARMVVDLRHEGSHGDLPSLELLRMASTKVLSWLKSYYWDPQKNAIPYQRSKSANVRKEIRSRLRELSFCLKHKQSSRSSSSQVKGKRSIVHGRSKLLTLVANKLHSFKYGGSRKQIPRILENLVRLYTFFSSDVVSVLLELLLKASNSTDVAASPDNFQINLTLELAQLVFDDWRPVVTKFSKKEPELLLSLLKAVLDMIETRKAIRDDFAGEHFSLSQYDLETQRIEVLSSLFTWLLLILKGLKPPHGEGQGSQTESAYALPKPTLIELTKRCLLISDPENHELLGSGALLSKMAGNKSTNDKLHKLSLLTTSSSRLIEDNPLNVKAEDLLYQDKLIRQAAEKLKLIKHRKVENLNGLSIRDESVEGTNIWNVVKSWNPCPIGMLPRSVGSSGHLPVFNCGADSTQATDYRHKEALDGTKDKEEEAEIRNCGKREATCDTEDDVSTKRMKEMDNVDPEPDDVIAMDTKSDGIKGRLLINGVWQMVGCQEVEDIKSRVNVLVTTRAS